MSGAPKRSVEEVLRQHNCCRGENLADLTFELPVLFVFLRHLGCTFCREALYDIARQRGGIEMEGACVCIVHMSTEEEAKPFFESADLADVIRTSDPDRELYRAFHLRRGGWHRLLGLKVWLRGFVAGVVRGHGLGPAMGDVTQMPGVFLVHEGEIINEYRHKSPADRPDYVQIASYPFEVQSLARTG